MRLSLKQMRTVAFKGTRREFLRQCSTFLAAAAFAPLGAFGRSAPLRMKDVSLNELSYSALARQVNTTFRVEAAPTRIVELELVQATLTPQRVPATGAGSHAAVDYEQFSLVFRGDANQPLQQKMFRFEHEQIGRFDLFIVPVVSRDTSHAYYEAAFNRPRTAITA